MIRLSGIFSDGMVLQGGRENPVWGEADGKDVTLRIQGRTVTVPVDAGHFSALLPILEYGTGFTLEIEGKEKLLIHDVAVGEVWLCGGQSNMEFQLLFDRDFASLQPGAADIRCFGVPQIADPEALSRFDYSQWDFWRRGDTRDDLGYFTAVGYYAAAELTKRTGHTVGIINCSWGGTAALPWLDPATIQDTPAKQWIGDYEADTCDKTPEQLRKEYLENPASDRGRLFDDAFNNRLLYGISRQEQEAMMRSMPSAVFTLPYHDAPGILYKNMVLRIAPYGIKGVFWYQGETDTIHPELYGDMLAGVISSWRKAWNEDVPFYIVQLTSFERWLMIDGRQYPQLRDMQERVTDTLPGVWLVSTMDCGMRWDLHAKGKQPVGRRLGLLALKESYGENILAGSPRPVRSAAEPGMIRIFFDNAEGGLVWNEPLEGSQALQITVDGQPCRDFWWETDRNAMVIGSRAFRSAASVQIAYAQRGYDPVNVFSLADFSVRPFRMTVEIP